RDHALAVRKAARHDDAALTLVGDLKRACLHGRVRLDDVRENPVGSPLYRGGRYGQRILLRAHEHSRGDEFARPQTLTGVVERRLDADRARALVYLVVDERDSSAVELTLPVA